MYRYMVYEHVHYTMCNTTMQLYEANMMHVGYNTNAALLGYTTNVINTPRQEMWRLLVQVQRN